MESVCRDNTVEFEEAAPCVVLGCMECGAPVLRVYEPTYDLKINHMRFPTEFIEVHSRCDVSPGIRTPEDDDLTDMSLAMTCPACDELHRFPVSKDGRIQLRGHDMEKQQAFQIPESVVPYLTDPKEKWVTDLVGGRV